MAHVNTWAFFMYIPMRNIYLYLLFFVTSNFYGQLSIEGKIIDGEFNDFLPFANVQLSQLNPGDFSSGTTSDFDGNFFFNDIPEGEYEITISFVGYESQKIVSIKISPSDPKQIFEIVLQPASSQLEEVIVTTTAKRSTSNAVLNIQKRSAVLIDGLSLQNIRKAGDSDIASAMKRIPGISIDGGKYVYVRGLGDRYSKTILNGLELPGLDPDKNTLQLDIFPTNLIENIQVVKSASSKFDADFTGGIVNIILKEFANSPEFNISVGTSYNPKMHLKKNYIYDLGSNTDFLGFDGGYRDLLIPRLVNIPNPSRTNPETSVITNYTSRLNGNLQPTTGTSFVNYNIGLSTSNSFNLNNGKRIGYIANLNYRTKITSLDDFLNSTYIFNEKDLSLNSQNDGNLGRDERFINLLTGLTYGSETSKYKVNFLLIQNGESNARSGNFSRFVSDDFFGIGNFITYTQRRIMSLPVSVKYIINEENNSELKINANLTNAVVRDKDFKVTVFETLDNGKFSLSNNGAGFPQRFWRDLEEDVLNFKLDYSINYNLGETKIKFDVGGSYLHKNRLFNTDFFSINHVGSNLYLEGLPNNLLKPENIWTFSSGQGSHVSGSFQEENQFDSKINKTGAYISKEFNFNENIKAVVGLRYEGYQLIYTGQSISGEVFENSKFIDRGDFFPSGNLIYSFNENRKLRFSTSKTTARPSFKENSSAVILDPITGNTFYGNINLQPSIIQNYDLRFENYADNGEFFALSGFYKYFDDPIEIVLLNRSTPDIFIARNNPTAAVFGIELELRKNLLINDKLKFDVNSNFSVIESRQTMGEVEKNTRLERQPADIEFKDYRQLQGQAPYIINVGSSFENFEKNFELNLFFNRQGKTLQIVGNDDVPDVFTVPFNSFNFTFEKKFNNSNKLNTTFRLKVDNILNDKRESRYEFFDFQTQPFSYRDFGRTFSLNYTISF